MTKRNIENEKKDKLVDEVSLVEEESSLAEFTKRNLPTEEEVQEFDDIVSEEIREESREEEVDDSLSEIYQDDNGKMVDVKKLYIKKRHGFLYWFFALTSFSIIVFSLLFYFYENYYLTTGTDATAVEFQIKGESEVIVNQEFYYTVSYNNLSNVNLSNATIELAYPENFVFIDSEPSVELDKNNVWKIDSIPPQHTGKIKIKGKIIDKPDSVHVVLARLNYIPDNFSSNFKKESSITTVVEGSGLNIDFDYISTALVGEENEIIIKYNALDENYIGDFRILFNQQENIKVIGLESASEDEEKRAKFELIRPGVWRINEILAATREVAFKFDFNEKEGDRQELVFILEKKEGDRYMSFLEKKIDFEVMNSDLNLTLIVNGSRDDQGVDAGEVLNYSIVYNNKGETDMKNVVIMAVLESDFLDWNSLTDASGGKESGNTIAWTKEQIPELESLAKHKEGTIDFSIKVKNIEEIEIKESDSNFEIKAYAQFSVGKANNIDDKVDGTEENVEDVVENDNNSNTIVNRINSNLILEESVRYFDTDNNTVGAGPHPPKVGEETKYRVYWNLTNTLHELNNLQVTVDLPSGVSWGGKDIVSVGTIVHDEISKKIVWNIGRFPATINKADAQFDIAVNPSEDNRDKIMVLLPGSSVSAIDKVSEGEVGQSTKAKTTRLIDDDIAIGDGVVK